VKEFKGPETLKKKKKNGDSEKKRRGPETTKNRQAHMEARVEQKKVPFKKSIQRMSRGGDQKPQKTKQPGPMTQPLFRENTGASGSWKENVSTAQFPRRTVHSKGKR